MAASKVKPSVGDVILIPVSKEDFAVAKILFLSKRFKRLMILGVATDRTVKGREAPAALPERWPLTLFVSVSPLEQPEKTRFYTGGPWLPVGHDPRPVPPDATLRVVADSVYREDEEVREATREDSKKIPVQAMGDALSAEWDIQKAMGLPETPDDAPGVLGTAAAAAAPAPAPAKAAGKAAPAGKTAAPAKVAGKSAAPKKAAPSALGEDAFWKLIEEAWDKGAPALAKKRPGVARAVSSETAEELSRTLGKKVVPALKKVLGKLTREELGAFDRILAQKLYDLDRAEVQRHTDGSDDGFLYARGFIVGMGRGHYDQVNEDPAKALSDMEEERITYLPGEVFQERFDEPIPPAGVSRESGSNRAGWK